MLERAGVLKLDFALLAGALGLIAFSIYTLGQATAEDVPGDPYFYVIRQAIYATVGIALMLAVARVDYSRFRELRVGIYSAMVFSICLVFVFAEATRGSRRWIELPFFTFQPSELGKVLLILVLAAVVVSHSESAWRRTGRILLLGAIPGALVFLQPDLGSSLVYGVVTLAVLFIAGTPWQHIAVIGTLAAAAVTVVLVVAPAADKPILQPYQEDRLTSFLSPSEDSAGSSYQINQSLISVGAGGKTGRGDEATQTRDGFLPERHTDFIFAVVGERYGFAGAAFILSLYALLIWRALRIMTLSKNRYGTIVAGSIAVAIMFQIFVNVGMNIGIAPITGIPLPLMSAGGSSVIVTFLALGLLQSIHVQSQLASRSRGYPTPLR
ncbi:MAG: rod shape-determining protein RodA [Actinomycetota bacterium]|nr:rod shape-determining protein RodA [Actinomycetota bacterium]